MKTCTKCKTELDESQFYGCKKTKEDLKCQCKKCHMEGNLRTRNKDAARDANRIFMKLARSRNPEKFKERERNKKPADPLKQKARAKFSFAVRSGKLTRPLNCSICGVSGVRIEGHHTDYSKPLDVVWLCIMCHGKQHRRPGEARKVPMRVWEAAIAVLKETDNPAIMWGDIRLLHMVAEKLGWEHEGPKTTDRVMSALSASPGQLIKSKAFVGNRKVNCFSLKQTA